MPTVYKVLGQSNPAATTATTLYTVPASTSAILSTVTVCNQAATSASFRIAVRPGGATLAAQHYVAYDIAIAANDTTCLTYNRCGHCLFSNCDYVLCSIWKRDFLNGYTLYIKSDY